MALRSPIFAGGQLKTYRMQLIVYGLLICWLSRLMLTETPDRRVINPKNFKPHGRPYSSSIQARSTVYVSGQGSQDADGKQPEGFDAQVRQCLNNVRAILDGGGMDLENVVWMHVYLTDLKNYEIMNKVY